MEQRIRHLMAAASRAESEGDARTAEILRRMAREALPLEPTRLRATAALQLRAS